ncbi:MAG: GNAT family N-acetyltransferase [Lentisphaerae bacterium]|jgi:predicted N-acetyltransferase YhbS|nr:GNAT family N-acetyltransferase [Lentisphaerota bacterium]MBT4815003.1 GNAT family N-acetyltransferase [Lentisphaerota bacterium]MBT5611075.1 GNAT family N-acetyltransferase [Lentisphaerota bacterium]MBT7055330.1 GNAT family N-acetyltransferase [Lentisphaerota bacterium]MBT7840531.1 GNAT family N-acetyltransferase [Lentisphaerota bacterium]
MDIAVHDLKTRNGCLGDVDTIADILNAAFQLEKRPEKQASARRLANHHFSEFLLLEDAGVTVGVAHIAPQWLQVGREAILKGDVGHVGVRPDRQGTGHGTRLLEACISTMHARGMHMSRLGGLMRFYRRFGYEPFPRRLIRIPVEPMAAVLKGRTWAEILALPPEQAQRVRPYHPARDYRAKHALLVAFNDGRSGAARTPDAPGDAPTAGPDDEGLEIVYEQDGVIRGYLRGALALVHARAPTPTYCVNTFAYDPQTPEACGALLKIFIRRAASIAPTAITARFPFDERVFADINAANIRFEAVELRQGADGNMVQVINLPALLEAISPELEHRIADAAPAPWTGHVRFVLPGQEAGLSVSPGGISTGATPENAVTVKTGHSTFLKWVFGISGFAEFADAGLGLTPPQHQLLATLFPRRPCASGVWG